MDILSFNLVWNFWKERNVVVRAKGSHSSQQILVKACIDLITTGLAQWQQV